MLIKVEGRILSFYKNETVYLAQFCITSSWNTINFCPRSNSKAKFIIFGLIMPKNYDQQTITVVFIE